MAGLNDIRKTLRESLKEYSEPVVETISEEAALKSEAEFAASNLTHSETAERVKAVQFMELLTENPFVQGYLIKALDDKDNAVVTRALNALSKVGKKDLAPIIREKMQNTKSRQLVGDLGRLLGKLEKEKS